MKIKRDILLGIVVVYLMLVGVHTRFRNLALSVLIGILMGRVLKNALHGLFVAVASYLLLVNYCKKTREGFDGDDNEDFTDDEVQDNRPLDDTADDDEPTKDSQGQMTPHQAQKETFKLVEALKELNNSIKTMEPTLKEGRKLLQTMEKFNL